MVARCPNGAMALLTFTWGWWWGSSAESKWMISQVRWSLGRLPAPRTPPAQSEESLNNKNVPVLSGESSPPSLPTPTRSHCWPCLTAFEARWSERQPARGRGFPGPGGRVASLPLPSSLSDVKAPIPAGFHSARQDRFTLSGHHCSLWSNRHLDTPNFVLRGKQPLRDSTRLWG